MKVSIYICIYIYYIHVCIHFAIFSLLVPSWALAIDPFLVSCAKSSAMLLPRTRKRLDGCLYLQGATERRRDQ